MAIRKFGQGEVTGADETYRNVQQQREAINRDVEDEHPGTETDLVEPQEDSTDQQ